MRGNQKTNSTTKFSRRIRCTIRLVEIRLKIVFRANKPIGRLFPLKDRVPSHVCSSVVYKFTCSSCQATYYGKTSRHFIVRCREHLGINIKGNNVKGAVNSAIKDHVKDTGHSVSLDDFCIIDKANNELELLINESLLILKDRPTLNFQSPSIPLFSLIFSLFTIAPLFLLGFFPYLGNIYAFAGWGFFP